MATLVLLRHGQSTWNLANRFTGWYDCDLSERGETEARGAGTRLADAGVAVAVVHTSVQTRAIRTAHLALTGLDKAETRQKYGDEQFLLWRRSYATPPPPINPESPWNPARDPRYAELAPELIPATECLADVVARMLPYWYDAIVPDLRANRVVLVSAHGNSLRGLVKHLDRVSDTDIPNLEIPTGV